MLVVVAFIELDIEFSQSLKDKRQVVRSLKDRLRNTFNVSANEVGLLDVHQRARLAVSFVAHDNAGADATLEKIEHFVESSTDAVLAEFTFDKIEY
jgi:uncharacterized protein YlxP (DUF503 family)